MRRGSCSGALTALLITGLASGAAAVEVQPHPPAICVAPAASEASPGIHSLYRARGGAGEVLSFGAEDPEALFADATAGTYTGTVGSGPFTLTVSGNKITGWKLENYFGCPSIDIYMMSLSTSCSIAGNNTFTCGSLGCSPSGNMRINGSFSGNTVSGKLDFDLDPDFAACCSVRNLSFFATLGGGGGGGAPAAPTNLVATAISDDEVELDWVDHANNELEFRVEMRQGSVGSFTDIGGVSANSRAHVSGLNPSTLYNFRVRARNASGDSPYSNIAAATTFGGSTGPCIEDVNTLCLNSGRFRIRATFRTSQGQSGQAQGVRLTSDTGYLWFFTDTNVEAVVKVLNACALNSRYWVFAGGLTDVEVIMTVTDTDTGATKTYTNTLGTKFAPIQDTGAFATCP